MLNLDIQVAPACAELPRRPTNHGSRAALPPSDYALCAPISKSNQYFPLEKVKLLLELPSTGMKMERIRTKLSDVMFIFIFLTKTETNTGRPKTNMETGTFGKRCIQNTVRARNRN